MPTSIIKTLDALRPDARARFEAFENDVLAESRSAHGPLAGIYLERTETLRTYDRSDYLYAQGRSRPGQIVTKARGGDSRHNFGAAVDYCPKYGEHGALAWNFDRDPRLMAAMRRAAELARKHGIEWGGNWTSFKDLPHFQVCGEQPLEVCRMKWPGGYRA